ncbi:MAG: carotenoid biosynthesis protein [Gammaproteobacteria bacterium]
MSNENKIINISWAVICIWSLVTLVSFFMPEILSANNARFINVLLLSIFTLVHGALRYGARGIVMFFAIACVVTNISENLSIITGFPFGQYHHTAAMGPKIWHVPIIIGPIFAVAGYLSWVLAGVLLRDDFVQRRASGFSRPLIAAFITTTWDFCVDAIGGTANRDWVWADGGPWFGVPWLNFFGWMLTMWLIFQLFNWYLANARTPTHIAARSQYWTQVVVYWTLIGLQFPLLAIIVPDLEFTDPVGHVWHSAHLFESMALVSVFTMLFISAMAFSILSRERPHS